MTVLAVLASVLLAAGPTVTLDPQSASVTTGQVVSFESVISNSGPGPTQKLVAHLNVAALDGHYVDLEDWSGDVTKVVQPMPAGGQTTIDWEVQAVNSGEFALYVSLVPTSGRGTVIAGQPMYVTVAAQRKLNSGGVLPVALAVPGFWAAMTAVAALRYRRTR